MNRSTVCHLFLQVWQRRFAISNLGLEHGQETLVKGDSGYHWNVTSSSFCWANNTTLMYTLICFLEQYP
jgi:hypothetical protein